MNSVEKGKRVTDKAIDMNEIGVDKKKRSNNSQVYLIWSENGQKSTHLK